MRCQRARQREARRALLLATRLGSFQACIHGTELDALNTTALRLGFCASRKRSDGDEGCGNSNNAFDECDAGRVVDIEDGDDTDEGSRSKADDVRPANDAKCGHDAGCRADERQGPHDEQRGIRHGADPPCRFANIAPGDRNDDERRGNKQPRQHHRTAPCATNANSGLGLRCGEGWGCLHYVKSTTRGSQLA